MRRYRRERVAGWGDWRGEPQPCLVLIHGERRGRIVIFSLRSSSSQGSFIYIFVQEGFKSPDRLQVIQDLGLVEHGEGSISDGHKPVSPEVHVNTMDVVKHHLHVCG